MKYDGLTDELIIEAVRGGDHGAADFLCDKYKNLVRSKAKTMYILGADTEDLIQEGMIGLFKAIRDYDPGRDASFMTFADLCVSRQMYTAVQASNRQKHIPLNSYISLYASKDDGEDAEGELINSLTAEGGSNPENLVIDRERLGELETIIENELSDFEREVLDLYITGMSYTQIGKVLGREEKSTDNALQRLKAKIRNKLKANQR